MGDILKEAIAEAKIVRDIAYQNAKATMTEAFEPRIKSMLSTRLQNEADDDTEDLGVDDIPKDEDETDDDETTEAVEDDESDNVEDSEVDVNEEDETTEDDKDFDEDDAEFESVLQELEDELNSDEEESDDDGIDTNTDNDMDEEADMDSDETNDDETDDDDEITAEDINSILASEEDDSEMSDDDKNETETETSNERLRKENRMLKKSIQKYGNTINFLKKELSEINLLNSKLLHTTKLFRRFSLQNEEKTKIVNTFDRTKNIREVKLVYTTIVESLKLKPASKRNKINENSSTFIGSTKPNRKDVITEDVDFKARMKKLANIK